MMHGRRVRGLRPPPAYVLILNMRYDLIVLDPLANRARAQQRYIVQNKICQQSISTAAEPSKQNEVLIDACDHPVDKSNVIAVL